MLTGREFQRRGEARAQLNALWPMVAIGEQKVYELQMKGFLSKMTPKYLTWQKG